VIAETLVTNRLDVTTLVQQFMVK